jgi:hypothetical protein
LLYGKKTDLSGVAIVGTCPSEKGDRGLEAQAFGFKLAESKIPLDAVHQLVILSLFQQFLSKHPRYYDHFMHLICGNNAKN